MPPKNTHATRASIPWAKTKTRLKKPKIPWAAEQHTASTQQPTPRTLHANQLRQAQGQAAENEALRHLCAHGLELVTRNYRCRGGEIDLIMKQGHTAIVVEVRQRSSSTQGTALDSIGPTKQQRVNRCAMLWWVKQGQHQFTHLRFDVVALQNGAPIQWIPNAWQISAL
jgi:putative endonuclease